MSDDIDAAVDSLSEHTKKLDVASFYTHGDMERAKQMVAGTYKDIYVIKGSFLSSAKYGAFIIFLNSIFGMLNSVYLIIIQSMYAKEIKTNIDWIIFEQEIADLLSKEEYDAVLGEQFRDAVVRGFTLQYCSDLKKLIEQEDEIAVNQFFQRFVQDKLGFQSVNVIIDCEQITSVDMELNSISSKKIDLNEFQKKKEEEEKNNEPEIEVDDDDEDDDALSGKEIKLMLNGALVLSPIKGIEISQLKVGDRIKISVIDTHMKAVHVAKAFNAYVDGEIKPIMGRIISFRHKSTGGYKIFAIVAKGIYVRINEEEESIKIAVDSADNTSETDSKTSLWRNILIIVILVMVFLTLVSIIIAFIK